MGKVPDLFVPENPKTEGQRLFGGVSGTLAHIGTALGVDGSTVHNWRSGKRSPGAGWRVEIERVYGIPVDAWGQAPTVVVGKPAPVLDPVVVDRDMKPDEALELRPRSRRRAGPTLVEQAEGQLRDAIADAATRGLVPSERAKARREVVVIMKTIDGMKRAAATFEADVVKGAPFYRRMKKALVAALLPFPDAARAVARAFADLDDKDDVSGHQGALDEEDEERA